MENTKKTEYDYGYEYAESMQGQDGFGSPVDIDKMVCSSVDIPSGDNDAMIDAGISNPDSRQYWEGFNSFFGDVSTPTPETTLVMVVEKPGAILFCPADEVENATIKDLIDAGYDRAYAGISEAGENEYGGQLYTGNFEGEKILEELQSETIDGMKAVRYWDGNNWKIDIYDDEDVTYEDVTINNLPDPDPAYYFEYELTRTDGEKITVTKSNMSGSISPYYEYDRN